MKMKKKTKSAANPAAMAAPFADPGFARVDTDRQRRCGFSEVIFAQGKTPGQVLAIARTLLEHGRTLLVTRATAAHAEAVARAWPEARWHELARCITVELEPAPKLDGAIGVICAGTADLPVAEEAAVTLELFGNRVERVTDVGVAGLHRLLAERDRIAACHVLIVVAGMEGALPSVVAGLVDKPVIAVPTSVGYGANFGGIAALLGMLTSCGSGVTVVNIDNGFGAAYAAAQINRLVNAAR